VLLRRRRANAPNPDAISARLATNVTGSINSGPPVLGSGLAVAVAVGLAVAVAVAVAVGLADRCCSAEATGANSKTTTALKANRSRILFMKYLLFISQTPPLR
jgi:hypothetical protein